MDNGNERHAKDVEVLAGGQEEAQAVKKEVKEKRKLGEHGENLIVNSSNQVIDVVDLINNANNPLIAVRLKTLFENGITQKMVEDEYFEISAGVSDVAEANVNMIKVCNVLIQKLSNIPNGIVIDPVTGEIDRAASLRQAIATGIYNENEVILKNSNEDTYSLYEDDESLLKKILESDLFSIEEKEQCNDILRSYISFNGLTYSNEEKEKIESLFNYLGISEEAKEKLNQEGSFAYLESLEDISCVQKAIWISNKDFDVSEQTLERTFSNSKTSKYYKEMLGEDGELDFEKVRTLADNWMAARNNLTLTKYLTKYVNYLKVSNTKFEDLDEINKRNITKTLARGYYSTDDTSKKLFDELCKNLGIGNDLDSIMKLTGISKEEDLKRIKENTEINRENYFKKMSNLKNRMQRTQADLYIEDLVGDIDFTNKDRKGAEAIARLYAIYYQKGNNSSRNKEEQSYFEISESLSKYMTKHKEYFSEYFSAVYKNDLESDEKINIGYVEKILSQKESSTEVKNLVMKKSSEIESKIESLKENDGKISDSEFVDFFKEKSEKIDVGNVHKERTNENSEKTSTDGDPTKANTEKAQRTDDKEIEKTNTKTSFQNTEAETSGGNTEGSFDKKLSTNDKANDTKMNNDESRQNGWISMLRNVFKRMSKIFSKDKTKLLEEGHSNNEGEVIENKNQSEGTTAKKPESFVPIVKIDHEAAINHGTTVDANRENNQHEVGEEDRIQ